MSTLRTNAILDASGGTTATVNGIPLRPGVLDPENRIINGAFDFWQRGTSFTGSGYGAVDRWRNDNSGGTVTQSQQSFTLGDTLGSNSPTFFLRQTVSGQTLASHRASTFQKIENVRSYAGQTITLLGWAKRSSGSGNMAVECEQEFGTGGSPSSSVNSIGVTTVTLTSSWSPFAVTVTVPSISGKTLGTNGNDSFNIIFWTSAGSDFNARTNTLGLQTIGVDLWGIHIKQGTHTTSAVDLYRQPEPWPELARCEKYYQGFGVGAVGAEESTTKAGFGILLITPMRAGPSISLRSSSINVRVPAAATDRTMASTLNASSAIGVRGGWLYLDITGGVSGRTIIERSGTTMGYADAEL
jgi:hypothetical protein